MSYHERRAVISALSAALIPMGYAAYAAQRYPVASPYDPAIFQFWGAFFLILIVVTIVGRIAVMIVFGIVNGIFTRETDPITDERDTLIELRAGRLSQYLFGVGACVGMAALVLGQPPAVMFALLVCAGVGSDLTSELAQFFLYRRGF